MGSIAGANALTASGRGIADPVTNGPLPVFDPFWPDFDDLSVDLTVELQTGMVEFAATGVANRLLVFG